MQIDQLRSDVTEHSKVGALLRDYAQIPYEEKAGIVKRITADHIPDGFRGTVTQALEYLLPIIRAELEKCSNRPGTSRIGKLWRAIFNIFKRK